MKTELIASLPAQVETECLVAIALDHGEKEKNEPRLNNSDAALNAAAGEVLGAGEFSGRIFETLLLHRPQGLKAKRLLLVGGGKAKNFSAHELRKLAGTAVRFLKGKKVKSLAFVLPDTWSGSADQAAHSTFVAERSGLGEAAKSIVEGACAGDYDPDTYKSDRKDLAMQQLTLVAREGGDRKPLEAAIEQGRVIGEAQNFSRVLVNEPSNLMTPTKLAEQAQAMAKECGLACEVYGPAEIREWKMGAFWSVAQGSEEEPRLIVMRYQPQGAPEGPVIGLVGKGVTFDTGGISIKPAEGMEKMKYDMAGGAAMIGAMRAIALLKPNVRVIGIVPATENMPSGKAQKPGDVQFAMNGKSIEIINTDAEGRLILADALVYARQLGCTHLVDAATLTGACVVALGMVNAGVFANDEPTFERFAQALQRSGEKMWRMPVDAEYTEQLKSGIADMMNVGGRWGGAVTAAMFLKEFVEDTPWIHLDIAGVAWVETDKPWIAKGPSGIAVRTLVEFVKGFENGS